MGSDIRKILVLLVVYMVVMLLGGCSLSDNKQRADVLQDVKNIYASVIAYCSDSEGEYGCDDGEELAINDFIHYYQISTDNLIYFHESWYDLDYDTKIAKYTSEGVYIFLEATGNNRYEFNGLIVDVSQLDSSDITRDED